MVKKKRMEMVWDPSKYQICFVCGGRHVKAYGFLLHSKLVCPWCHGRGGHAQILFMLFAEAMAKKPCRDASSIEALKGLCKCPSCVAQSLFVRRDTAFNTQDAPVVWSQRSKGTNV